MITELVARDEGGNGDHVVLGRPLALPPGDPGDTVGEDRVLEVSVSRAPVAGPDSVLGLVVRGPTAGSRWHSAPTSAPTATSPASTPRPGPWCTCTRSTRRRSPRTAPSSTFHADIEQPGDYRLFVQVRVDGFLHTVPVDLTVAPSA